MTRDEAQEVADQLTALIDQAGAAPTPVWGARRPNAEQADALRAALREGFAERHGWQWVNERASVKQINGLPDEREGRHRVCALYADHSSQFCTDGRIVVMVEQPYADDARFAEMIAWAEQHGLELIEPDWPSWYYPGRTRLCLFMHPETAETFRRCEWEIAMVGNDAMAEDAVVEVLAVLDQERDQSVLDEGKRDRNRARLMITELQRRGLQIKMQDRD